MQDLVIIGMLVLSTHRITRFIVRDCMPLISVPRDWILARTDPTVEDVANGRKPRGVFLRSIGYLLQCEWCVSIWVSAGLVFALTQFYDMTWVFIVGLWLSSSSVAALISERLEDEYEGCDV